MKRVFAYAIGIYCALSCVHDATGSTQPNADQLEKRIEDFLNDGYADRSWITPDIRPLVAQRLKERVASHGDRWEDIRQVCEELVDFRDPDACKILIALFESAKDEGGVYSVGNEALLPYIIPDVFGGSTQPRGGGDAFRYSTRQMATAIALRCIGNSDVFPQATREWANGNSYWGRAGLPDWERWNFLMREWWGHNMNAVLSHRYDQATWLHSPPEMWDGYGHMRLPGERIKSDDELWPAHPATPQPSPPTPESRPVSARLPAATTEPGGGASFGTLLAAGIGAILLAAAAVYSLLNRNRITQR